MDSDPRAKIFIGGLEQWGDESAGADLYAGIGDSVEVRGHQATALRSRSI